MIIAQSVPTVKRAAHFSTHGMGYDKKVSVLGDTTAGSSPGRRSCNGPRVDQWESIIPGGYPQRKTTYFLYPFSPLANLESDTGHQYGIVPAEQKVLHSKGTIFRVVVTSTSVDEPECRTEVETVIHGKQTIYCPGLL